MAHRYITFSDESHIGNHRYMVIGGLLCRPDEVANLRALVATARGRFPDHMKWERIRANNQHRYISLVRDFFALSREQRVDFSAVVFDSRKFDHAVHNKGDEELGFHKFVAQHLFRHARVMGRNATFESLYAHRSSRRKLTEVREALNGMGTKRWGDGKARFLELAYRPVKHELAFSLVDVLIGAVGAAYNNTLSGGPKTRVCDAIRHESGLPSLAQPTEWTRKNFDIWEIDLTRKAAGLAPFPEAASGSTERFGPQLNPSMGRQILPFKAGG